MALIPGEVITGAEPVELFAGAAIVQLTVTNTGDRAVQVGSHYHFAEASPALAFDRAAARGHRLAIPAGTSVRFEPGIERRVELVPLGGRRVVAGLRGEVAGPLDPPPGDSVGEGAGANVGEQPPGDLEGAGQSGGGDSDGAGAAGRGGAA